MSDAIPTLAAWAGGEAAFHDLTRRFYAKIPDDEILAPVFAGMDPHHAQLVASFLNEVFGGEATYTTDGGSHAGMIGRHLGRHLTETQRRRWVSLMIDTADEAGLPDDPEFRAAFVSYLEWGTRLAVINSREETIALDAAAPMPVWDWSPAGGPWTGGVAEGWALSATGLSKKGWRPRPDPPIVCISGACSLHAVG